MKFDYVVLIVCATDDVSSLLAVPSYYQIMIS